ncbi:MAG TPA: DinB family protein [Candidatus Kapabacteria bacterium]|nr:DinB family protein [Candidatus Kapabacteria bacterium]
MTRKSEILAAFEDAWSDPICESLTLALNGVPEESVSYQHPIYSDTKQEEDYPPAGTILWHLVHLAHCYRSYTSTIARRPEAPEDTSPPTSSSLAEAILNLKRDREGLRNAIAAVPEDQLDDNVFDYDSVAQLVRMIVRHDAWHASQIAVVKRMYRMR